MPVRSGNRRSITATPTLWRANAVQAFGRGPAADDSKSLALQDIAKQLPFGVAVFDNQNLGKARGGHGSIRSQATAASSRVLIACQFSAALSIRTSRDAAEPSRLCLGTRALDANADRPEWRAALTAPRSLLPEDLRSAALSTSTRHNRTTSAVVSLYFMGGRVFHIRGGVTRLYKGVFLLFFRGPRLWESRLAKTQSPLRLRAGLRWFGQSRWNRETLSSGDQRQRLRLRTGFAFWPFARSWFRRRGYRAGGREAAWLVRLRQESLGRRCRATSAFRRNARCGG